MAGNENDAAIAEACRMEHAILDHVKAALRVTLDWQTPAVGLEQKLSSVRFTFKSFQRHLERLMRIEEGGGYMRVVAESKPNLYDRVMSLRESHDRFREQLAEIAAVADETDDGDRRALERLCGQIEALLAEVDAHDRQEIGLIQDAILRDEGGEG
jgi:hypothetical protein